MLEPRDRALLLDILRPPVGFSLDFAIGTTYTLDLIALLGAPLAFALLDRTDRDGRLISDPIALVEALRRNAEKFAVFCQAGEIGVPPPERNLLMMLERNVIEVTTRTGGVFHPKVWALRFTNDQAEVAYRLVCGTRNLTFDRSWDTVLCLEGKLSNRKNAYAANRPVGAFIAALPRLAVNPVPPAIQSRVDQIQAELQRVDFEPPEPFESYAFLPIGHDGKRAWPFNVRMDRLAVLSPFVTDGFVERIAKECGDVRLISRADQLALVEPGVLAQLTQVDVFDDDALEAEVGEEEDPEASESHQARLTGLHAKLFVADAGWQGIVWTGSANATDAAFEQNVEFLIELEGKKSKCGVDALMRQEPGEPSIASFLRPWTPQADRASEDEALKANEQRIRAIQQHIATAGLAISFTTTPQSEGWRGVLTSAAKMKLQQVEGVSVSAWPITCRPEMVAQQVRVSSPDALATFERLSEDSLTSFLAFRIELSDGSIAPKEFVLNIPATGLPEDRHVKLLMKTVGRRGAFEEYLRMLLSGVEANADGQSLGSLVGLGAGEEGFYANTQPLFELLVRALHQDPGRIDDVARLVEEIEKSGKSADVLPEGFRDVWPAILEARKAVSVEDTPSP